MRRLGALSLTILFSAAMFAADGSPIANAAMNGDRESVRAFLKKGLDVNEAQGDGSTALHWAAIKGDAEMAQMLIYAGANVRATTRIGACISPRRAATRTSWRRSSRPALMRRP